MRRCRKSGFMIDVDTLISTENFLSLHVCRRNFVVVLKTNIIHFPLGQVSRLLRVRAMFLLLVSLCFVSPQTYNDAFADDLIRTKMAITPYWYTAFVKLYTTCSDSLKLNQDSWLNSPNILLFRGHSRRFHVHMYFNPKKRLQNRRLCCWEPIAPASSNILILPIQSKLAYPFHPCSAIDRTLILLFEFCASAINDLTNADYRRHFAHRKKWIPCALRFSAIPTDASCSSKTKITKCTTILHLIIISLTVSPYNDDKFVSTFQVKGKLTTNSKLQTWEEIDEKKKKEKKKKKKKS